MMRRLLIEADNGKMSGCVLSMLMLPGSSDRMTIYMSMEPDGSLRVRTNPWDMGWIVAPSADLIITVEGTHVKGKNPPWWRKWLRQVPFMANHSSK